MTLQVTFAVCKRCNSHTSGNIARIIYGVFSRKSESTYEASTFNSCIEIGGLFKVTGSHVHCKSVISYL